MKQRLGWRPFWPELEPESKIKFCSTCRSNTRSNHLSTKKHRYNSRAREYRKGSGDWLSPRPVHLVDPYGDNRDWDEEERLAKLHA